jgi:hypothetical protein
VTRVAETQPEPEATQHGYVTRVAETRPEPRATPGAWVPVGLCYTGHIPVLRKTVALCLSVRYTGHIPVLRKTGVFELLKGRDFVAIDEETSR